jgi:hypothetical protein
MQISLHSLDVLRHTRKPDAKGYVPTQLVGELLCPHPADVDWALGSHS